MHPTAAGDGSLIDLAASAVGAATGGGGEAAGRIDPATAAGREWAWVLAGPGAELDGLPARLAWEVRRSGESSAGLKRKLRASRPLRPPPTPPIDNNLASASRAAIGALC